MSEIGFLKPSDAIPQSVTDVLVEYFGSEKKVDEISLNYLEEEVDGIWTIRLSFKMPSYVIETIGGVFVDDYDKSLSMFNKYLLKELKNKQLRRRMFLKVREQDTRFTDIGL